MAPQRRPVKAAAAEAAAASGRIKTDGADGLFSWDIHTVYMRVGMLAPALIAQLVRAFGQ